MDTNKTAASIIYSACAIPVILAPIMLFAIPQISDMAKSNFLAANGSLLLASVAACLISVGLISHFCRAKFFRVPLISQSLIPEHALPTDQFEALNNVKRPHEKPFTDEYLSTERAMWDKNSPMYDTYHPS